MPFKADATHAILLSLLLYPSCDGVLCSATSHSLELMQFLYTLHAHTHTPAYSILFWLSFAFCSWVGIENCTISKRIQRDTERWWTSYHSRCAYKLSTFVHALNEDEHCSPASETPTIYDFIGMHARRQHTLDASNVYSKKWMYIVCFAFRPKHGTAYQIAIRFCVACVCLWKGMECIINVKELFGSSSAHTICMHGHTYLALCGVERYSSAYSPHTHSLGHEILANMRRAMQWWTDRYIYSGRCSE